MNQTINTRKASVFRIPLEKAFNNNSTITAAEILPKLELFYKAAMSTFVHHLDQVNFKTKNVMAKTATGNKGTEI